MNLTYSLPPRPAQPRVAPAGAAVGLVMLLVALGTAGCATEPRFPAAMAVAHDGPETVFAFDTDRDRRPDFWQFQGPAGRKHAIAYPGDVSGRPGERIDLDRIAAADCPHLLIVLDGVPFEIVAELYEAGQFRFFHAPARVVCGYPSMTDLALADVFDAGPCPGFQALYYDRGAGRLSDSSRVYLSGQNAPWASQMDYRCSYWWDALVYLNPQAVFNHELQGIVRAFRDVEGDGRAYSVGTAGLGTRGGRDAIVKYLGTIERLCDQLVFERRGRVKITLIADHGHNLVENRLISFKDVLAAGGYRLSGHLGGPRDVVQIAYGLVTYAEFFTPDPAGMAACLLNHEDIEFACICERPVRAAAGELRPAAALSDDSVVVLGRDGRARITKGAGGFVYDDSGGDPLELRSVLDGLRSAGHISPTGEIDGEALFQATLDHRYPDPLVRLWRAFHGLVENPPDVIVNLRDGACHGSRFFHTMIGRVASTHGGLDRRNSTTFLLTMLGPPPAALRSQDVVPVLESLRRE